MSDDEDSDSEDEEERGNIRPTTHDHDDVDENVGDDDEEEDVGECVVMYRLPRYLRVHSSWHLAPSATQLQHHSHRHVLGLFKDDLISERGGVNQKMTKQAPRTFRQTA